MLRAARKLALTPDQDQQLEKILDDYRTSIAVVRGEKTESTEERVEQLIKNIRSILTQQQTASYDKEIAALRENPPPVTPFPPPGATTQPAGAPPAPPPQPPPPARQPSGK